MPRSLLFPMPARGSVGQGTGDRRDAAPGLCSLDRPRWRALSSALGFSLQSSGAPMDSLDCVAFANAEGP